MKVYGGAVQGRGCKVENLGITAVEGSLETSVRCTVMARLEALSLAQRKIFPFRKRVSRCV